MVACGLAPFKADAAKAINLCFEEMYLLPLWIPASDAKRICGYAFCYLRLYQQMAVQASQEGRMLFLFNAKSHMLSHIFRVLSWESELSSLCMNPLCWGVQLDEDLIGKASRVSRHVTSKPHFQIRRTLERWLISSQFAWTKSGMLKSLAEERAWKELWAFHLERCFFASGVKPGFVLYTLFWPNKVGYLVFFWVHWSRGV